MSRPHRGGTCRHGIYLDTRCFNCQPDTAPTLDVERLRAAIEDVLGTLERVVTDSESQHPGGWGPDITTVADLRDCQVVLRAALSRAVA